MNDHLDTLLDAAAEAVVFAHEPDAPPLPLSQGGLPASALTALERTAALAAAALSQVATATTAEPTPATLQQRLAAAGLGYCAEQRRRFAAHAPGFTTTLPRRRPLALVMSFAVGAAA
jgi:hypothetical protein